MFKPLERLLDTPALVIKLTKALPGEIHRVQIRCHHTHPGIGGHVANQSHLRGGGRTSPILHILSAGRAQRHISLLRARSQKLLDSRPAGDLLVATHTEANPSLTQQRHQPGSWLAPVKQQNVIGPQTRQCLHQHRPLRGIGTVNTGVRRHLPQPHASA